MENELIRIIQFTLKALRDARDSKPKEWDALVTPEMCNVWDLLVAVEKQNNTCRLVEAIYGSESEEYRSSMAGLALLIKQKLAEKTLYNAI